MSGRPWHRPDTHVYDPSRVRSLASVLNNAEDWGGSRTRIRHTTPLFATRPTHHGHAAAHRRRGSEPCLDGARHAAARSPLMTRPRARTVIAS